MSFDPEKFKQRHTQLDEIPSESIEAGQHQLAISDLYRYHCNGPESSAVALLERDFSKYAGVKYSLAVNSCGSALLIALKSLGINSTHKVLTQAYTFTAVPSAIMLSGAETILAEIDSNYCINTDNLSQLLDTGISAIIVSHMKGHVGNMDIIPSLCKQRNIPVIEDAAHALGCYWGTRHVGTIGDIGCFSFQSSKIINGGEGGILVTDNAEIFAKALLLSGAFQDSFQKHFIDDEVSLYINKYRNKLPMFSMRMSNLTASIIRPQILNVKSKASRYLENYQKLVGMLNSRTDILLPKVDAKVTPAPDAIQFQLRDLSEDVSSKFIQLLSSRGITAHMTGRITGNVRAFWNWEYLDSKASLPTTQAIIKNTCDIRLPYRFETSDIDYIGKSIIWALDQLERFNEEQA